MKYIAVKSFRFSRDGVTTEQAQSGDPVDIPAILVKGLFADGYIRLESEGKMLSGAPENKGGLEFVEVGVHDIVALRKEYHEMFGKKPFPGWKADKLQSMIDAKK